MTTACGVVCAANQRYIPYLSAALTWARHNADPSVAIAVTVLSRDVSPADVHWPNRRLGDTLRCLPPDIPAGTTLPVRNGDHVSEETYYRLFLNRVFDSTVRQSLYLDADLVVLGDLSRLMSTPLDGKAAAAALDLHVRRWSAVSSLAKRGSPDNRYVNAGVLLIDIEAWRARQLSERSLQYLHEVGDEVGFWDQDALSHALSGDWIELDPRWNRLTDYWVYRDRGTLPFDAPVVKSLEAPCIVQFASRFRPRQSYRHADRGDFDRYIVMAGFPERRMTLGKAMLRKVQELCRVRSR